MLRKFTCLLLVVGLCCVFAAPEAHNATALPLLTTPTPATPVVNNNIRNGSATDANTTPPAVNPAAPVEVSTTVPPVTATPLPSAPDTPPAASPIANNARSSNPRLEREPVFVRDYDDDDDDDDDDDMEEFRRASRRRERRRGGPCPHCGGAGCPMCGYTGSLGDSRGPNTRSPCGCCGGRDPNCPVCGGNREFYERYVRPREEMARRHGSRDFRDCRDCRECRECGDFREPREPRDFRDDRGRIPRDYRDFRGPSRRDRERWEPPVTGEDGGCRNCA